MSPRPLSRASGPAIALLLTGALLTGCSGGGGSAGDPAGDADATPTVSTTPDATPTGTPTGDPSEASSPEPRPSVPPARSTEKSAGAFARTVVDSWGYALRHNSATALTRLAPGGRCEGCAALAAELRTRLKDGWHADFPGARIRSLKTRSTGDGEYTSTLRVALPASRSYFDDGTFRNDNPAHPQATFIVRSRFVQAGFGRPDTGVPRGTPRFALVAFFLR